MAKKKKAKTKATKKKTAKKASKAKKKVAKSKPAAKKKVAKKKAVKKKEVKKKVAKKKVAKKKVAKKKVAKKKVAKKPVAKKPVAKKAAKKKISKKATGQKVEKKVQSPSNAGTKKTVKKKVAAAQEVETPKADKASSAPAKKKVKKASKTSLAQKIKIEQDIVLTDAEGRILCRVRDCDQPAVVESYCRYHYLLYWKKIQIRKKILSEGKLEKYIEELTSRYPNKYLDLIKKDLSTESDFLHAIQELEIDESSGEDDNRDYDEERSFIEEVRGVSDSSDRDDNEY